MPIYAYKCSSCGHTQDVLQKISATPLTDCPACGKATYSKQVTAPQFQLKGSGWYVTDFKGGGSAPKENKGASEPKAESAAESKPKEKSAGESSTAPTAPATPAAAATPPAAVKATGE